MPEIRKTDDHQMKKVETRAAKPLGDQPKVGGIEIIGGSSNVSRTGKPRVIDKNSPAEEVQAELHVHADRASYKEALEKDQ